VKKSCLKRRTPLRAKGRSRFPKTVDLPYRAWICSLPCLIRRKHHCQGRPNRRHVEPAHVKTWGSSGQDRGNLVPLCPAAHDEQEGRTRELEERYGVDLKYEAERLAEVYRQEFAA
jgi:hypothetical protein